MLRANVIGSAADVMVRARVVEEARNGGRQRSVAVPVDARLTIEHLLERGPAVQPELAREGSWTSRSVGAGDASPNDGDETRARGRIVGADGLEPSLRFFLRWSSVRSDVRRAA